MSKPKKVELTPRKLRELKSEITNKCVILMAACAMDSLQLNKDQIVEFATDFQRYSEAVEDHIITLQKVQDILEEEIGLRIESWKS